MHRPPHRWAQLALATSFGVVLTLPLARAVLGPEVTVSEAEKRALEPAPVLGVDLLETLPDKTTQWFDDHFGFRDPLMRWHGHLKYTVFRASNDEVLIGRDDWLYLKGEETLGDYRGQFLFEPHGLNRYERILEARVRSFEQSGVTHLWAIVPNKVAIHPEHLPASVRDAAGERRLDQLLSHLEDRSSVEVVDFRRPLLEVEGEALLYHRNDTHWNDRGVFLAYQHLCSRLGSSIPNLEPLGSEDLAVTRASHHGDLTKLLGVEDGFRDTYDALAVRRPLARSVTPPTLVELPERDVWGREVALYAYEGPPDGPRLLMFVDSFATPLFRQLVASHFSRALFIQASPSLATMEAVVAREQPDVVIEEVAERLLGLAPADYPQLRAPNRR